MKHLCISCYTHSLPSSTWWHLAFIFLGNLFTLYIYGPINNMVLFCIFKTIYLMFSFTYPSETCFYYLILGFQDVFISVHVSVAHFKCCIVFHCA